MGGQAVHRWRRSGVLPMLHEEAVRRPERLLQTIWHHQRLRREQLTTSMVALCRFNGFPEVPTILSQPDGKILVGGFFNSYQGVSRNSLVRLLPDGSVDHSFDSL